MWCRVCLKERPLNGFIPCPVTILCRHTDIICLVCVVNAAMKTGKCAYPDCGVPVNLSRERIHKIKTLLRTLYPQIYERICNLQRPKTSQTPKTKKSGSINVQLMTGMSHAINVNLQDTVLLLKSKISAQTKVPEEKQKLLHDEKELTDYLENGKEAQLVDFGLEPNASISLVIILYALPPTFNHVTFDLFWGYPSTGKDFLDASCLIFSGFKMIATVDYLCKNFKNVVRHSGDVMDNENKIGHHTIEVYLHKIPKEVTHLFFTLSAWNNPTIGCFPNPSLNFYEASNSSKDLCSTTFTHAKESTAVVMCSVSRRGDKWNIFESGQLSNGNAKNYAPLKETACSLIKRGV